MLQWRWLLHLILIFHFSFMLQFLQSASSTFSNINIQTHYHIQHQGLMMLVDHEYEVKTRLGSTPPSCHNKCSRCHPCMAVQAPSSSLPSHHRFHPSSIHHPLDSSSYYNKYSNYKPLGWKCRCGDHFYNP